MTFREITTQDVPAMFDVRIATRENAYTREELYARGITEVAAREMLKTSHAGWLCEVGGHVVGFSMADGRTGEMRVIAVVPEFEGQGVGVRLLRFAEDWLWARGWQAAWLTTSIDPTLRAYGLYRKQGWEDDETRDGLRYMKKRRPENPKPRSVSGSSRSHERHF